MIRSRNENERLKDATLRALDDTGAETLRLYELQVQYAASLCVRMLRDSSRIEAVIPEGGEDVVVMRAGVEQLRQVKTRAESQGPWTLREALTVICRQYSLRGSFKPGCTFHFVSNQGAHPKEKPQGLLCGPLYRLKDVLREQGVLDTRGALELQRFETALCPLIVATMRSDYGDVITDAEALDLLHRTRIETAEERLKEYNWPGELHSALSERLPGHSFEFDDLLRFQSRIHALVVDRTVNELSVEERTIRRADVTECCLPSGAGGLPTTVWDAYPGKNRLEQKCHAGGFETERIRNFTRQKFLASEVTRQFDVLGRSTDVERLATYLSGKQHESLDAAIAAGHTIAPGPAALHLIKGELSGAVRRYFSAGVPDGHDDDFGEGLLWRETERCYVNWGVAGAPKAP